MNQHYIFELIKQERKRQDTLHPHDHEITDLEMFAVLSEEIGEVAKALLENTNLEEELVQVASVCIRWLEMKER